VLLQLPTAPRVTAPACPDALPVGVPRRVGDGLAEALRAAGFTVVEDAAAPHGFVAVVDVEVRYCNADVGLVNGVVGLDLQRAGVRVRQSVAEGELSTPSPVASIARDVVDVLIHDSAVIAAVDAAGAGG
jgi:hypothetical protein